MGLIYNSSVPETEIMNVYGLTVYGKINKYDWTIFNKEPENVLVSIRIADTSGNDLINLNLGNNCIFPENIETTMDNFLYWIKKKNPDRYTIENNVYNVLCISNSLFNHRIMNEKLIEQRENENKRLAEERLEKERERIGKIDEYCKEKGLFYFIGYEDVIILKVNTNSCRKAIAEAQKNNDSKQMRYYIEFAEKYPENNDLWIVKRATMEELLKSINLY